MAAIAVIGLGGIGSVVAQELAQAGHLVVAGRYSGHCPSGSGFCELKIDVTDLESCRAFFAAAKRDVGKLAGVVNCFGSLHANPALAETCNAAMEVFRTHVGGVVNVSRAASSTFIKSGGGTIVNFASIAAHQALPGLAVYGAAKAAVIAFTRTLALELAGQAVRANVVVPGYVNAGGTAEQRPQLVAALREHVPLKRFADAREIAALVAYLLSDSARYITGQTFVIDGGMSCGPQGLLEDVSSAAREVCVRE